MAIQVEIRADGCRGCEMCADVCPTKVFAVDASKKATVQKMADCIGCLSCAHLCPSGAVKVSGHQPVRNFYRDLEFVGRMGRYL